MLFVVVVFFVVVFGCFFFFFLGGDNLKGTRPSSQTLSNGQLLSKDFMSDSVLWTTVIKILSCQIVSYGQLLSRYFHVRLCPMTISPDVILCGWLGLKHQLTKILWQTVIKRLPCQTLSYEQLLPRLFYDDCYQQTSMPNIVLLTTVIKKLSCPCPMDNCYQETVMSECSMVDCCQKTFMLDIIVWTSVMKRLSCQAMSSKQRLSRDFYIRHCPMGNC